MTDKNVEHPEKVLSILLQNAKNIRRREGLLGLHKICEAQHQTSQDFSRSTLGKLCKVANVFGERLLYNAGSDDYRALVAAWEAYSLPMKKPKPSLHDSHWNDSLLRLIDNPALRALVQEIQVRNGRLRAELNMLKSISKLVADRRPSDESSATLHAFSNTIFTLKPSEFEALRDAVSKDFLTGEGWVEGRLGDVKSGTGRTIYGPGYTFAIRRILDWLSKPSVE